jgi:hypothetical protein
MNQANDAPNTEVPRLIPALVAFLHPFTIVLKDDEEEWETSIEEINTHSYDYVRLHRITGGIDVGLPAPYHMLVGYDGALALPPIEDLRSVSKVVEFFNKRLAELLVGGIYCEVVSPEDLDTAKILDWTYIRIQGQTQGFVGQYHFTIRLMNASPMHSINLLSPRQIRYSELVTAIQAGNTILNNVPELSADFLLRGVSSLVKRDWSSALSSLWTVDEQIISHLWTREIVDKCNSEEQDTIPGRRDSLKDHRTWSASPKSEMLFRIGVIDYQTLKHLAIARKARNDLHHKGIHPTADAAKSAYEGFKRLLQICTDIDVPLFDLIIEDYTLADPFERRSGVIKDVQYWMEFPKLPGEDEATREEIEAMPARHEGEEGAN